MRYSKLVLVFSLAFLVVVSGCKSNRYEKLEPLEWLLGNWKGRTPQGMLFVETWERSSATSLAGKGCALSEQGDTLFRETLRIDLVEGVPYYIATVPENPGPVLFKLSTDKNNTWIFENKEHDFPQRIIYTQEKEKRLTVRLEGMAEGRPKREELSFEKE